MVAWPFLSKQRYRLSPTNFSQTFLDFCKITRVFTKYWLERRSRISMSRCHVVTLSLMLSLGLACDSGHGRYRGRRTTRYCYRAYYRPYWLLARAIGRTWPAPPLMQASWSYTVAYRSTDSSIAFSLSHRCATCACTANAMYNVNKCSRWYCFDGPLCRSPAHLSSRIETRSTAIAYGNYYARSHSYELVWSRMHSCALVCGVHLHSLLDRQTLVWILLHSWIL